MIAELSPTNAVFQEERPNYFASQARTSTLTVRGAKVRVASPRPWLMDLKRRFDELTELPRGWDGYGGRPVSFTCAQFAANLLERLFQEGVPAPSLVPGGDGTLQFEWHRNLYDVEVDVLGPYDVVAVRRDLVTGRVEELELTADFTPLSDWISDLARVRIALAAGGA